MNRFHPIDCCEEFAELSETPLKRAISQELERYFDALAGEQPCGLYKMVIGETELALLQFVLERTAGNQSRAAQLLGVNRGTLRKKLKYYGLEPQGAESQGAEPQREALSAPQAEGGSF